MSDDITPEKAATIADPAYILTSVTTEQVVQYYESLSENAEAGERLLNWEELPTTEKANIVLACQDFLQNREDTTDLIDVINENIDADLWMTVPEED